VRLASKVIDTSGVSLLQSRNVRVGSSSRFSATLSHFFLRWLPISDNFVIAIVTFCLIPAKCGWLRPDLTIDSFWRKADHRLDQPAKADWVRRSEWHCEPGASSYMA